MQFIIYPYTGIGNGLSFSESKSSITQQLGNYLSQEFYDTKWGILENTQYYDSIGLSVHYDVNDSPIQFNIHQPTGGKILFRNHEIMQMTYNQVKEFLRSCGDSNLIETDATRRCIYSFKFGFYTYFELIDSRFWKNKEMVAMAGVFRQGMHADVMK